MFQEVRATTKVSLSAKGREWGGGEITHLPNVNQDDPLNLPSNISTNLRVLFRPLLAPVLYFQPPVLLPPSSHYERRRDEKFGCRGWEEEEDRLEVLSVGVEGDGLAGAG